MPESRFPVAQYLKMQVLDGRTISRTGAWWSAALVIQDPRSSKPYIAFYKWNFRSGEWKRASSFKLKSQEHLDKLLVSIDELAPLLDEHN